MLADLRMALRRLGRAPGYVTVVVTTLALGIGGVAAVFTLADPMIFRPLPYAHGDRVVEVRARVGGSTGSTMRRLHADDFVAIAARSHTLEDVAMPTGLSYGYFRGGTGLILGYGVSSRFLRLTGLRPARGRVFTPDEYDRDASQPPQVAMLTWAFWRQAFGGADDVIGSRLDLTGPQRLSMTIVGVLPPTFFFPQAVNQPPGFIVPGELDPRDLGRANISPIILARVRPEYTFAQADAELTSILAAVEREHPSFGQGRQATVIPLQDVLFGDMRTPLLLLFLSTICLLALACVNLAHLAHARAAARARDFAVRAALGAGRWHLARLMLAEAAVLAAGGAAAGIVAGDALFAWGVARAPRFSYIYRLLPAGLDARVVLFAVALAALGMIALALWPAWAAARSTLRDALAAVPGRRGRWRARGESIAIAGQTMFAVALGVTCLLVVHAFVALLTADRGFDPADVEIAGVTLPGSTPAERLTQYRALVSAFDAQAGVRAAAVANGVPGLTLPEAPVDAQGAYIKDVVAYQASGRFAAAMGMRLDEGRLFADEEAFAGAPVAVVDRSAADLMWPGRPALGQTVRLKNGRAFVVVGVLARMRPFFFSQDDSPEGTVLVSIDTTSARTMSQLTAVIRRDDRRPARAAALEAAAARAVPGMTWTGVSHLSSWERFVGEPRFLASALGLLAVLTIALAAFGLYGVVSHLVSRRTREIGIRMALGADRMSVRRLVVRQAIVPAFGGVAVGLVLASWWSAAVRAVIVGIAPRDPWAFGGAGVIVILTVVVASLGPAVRASRVDPARTLRAE